MGLMSGDDGALPNPRGVKLTYDDFVLFPDEGRRHELIDVIEIGSPSTRRRDETLKRTLYERAGVSEYWIVDPELDVVRVYRRQGARLAKAVALSAAAHDALTTALLPGLELALEDIFRM